MPLSPFKFFGGLLRRRRVAKSIQTPIVNATAKQILEDQKPSIDVDSNVDNYTATKKAGFGLFNFLGAGS